MPQPQLNQFQTYSFTPEEIVQAKALSALTKMYLQHELSITLMRKCALIYNHADVKDWELLHAELDGRANILAELLEVPTIKETVTQKE